MASVRHHVAVQATLQFPDAVGKRAILALSAIAGAMMDRAEALDLVIAQVAPAAEIDTTLALRVARQLQEEQAHAGERAAAAA